jgi:integrase/recombinase XerD
MRTIKEEVDNYLFYCREQRRLDDKTIRAYKNDLIQFEEYLLENECTVSKNVLNSYIVCLHGKYKPKTVKRKIASLKAFYTFLEREEIINDNPMRKVRTQFREEKVLPKTIPADIIEKLLSYMYMKEKNGSNTKFQTKIIARDISVVELLFATGLRISELCNLKKERFNINDGILCIKGKGAKERYLQVGNPTVLEQMGKYNKLWEQEINNDIYFFYNRNGGRYSEQSARRMIKKYVEEAHIDMHITPHMFRHAFATLLLEEEVDIRYIQKLLGHSSIVTTQIYTEVACKKQMEILRLKHPRNKMMKDVN